MEAVRKILNIDVLQPIIDLPWKSSNMQVEVIIMPLNEVPRERLTTSGKSPKGCLKAYANSALREKELCAWENSIAEKYGAA